jgi:paraquat-inducible protein B
LKKKHQISGIRNHRRTVVDSVLWLAPLCAVVVAGWLAMIDQVSGATSFRLWTAAYDRARR